MTHGTTYDDVAVPSAREQELRERDWDRSWGPLTALRETGHLGPAATMAVVAVVGVYLGGWMAWNGDALAGIGVGAVALVGGGLALDTHLCKGTPANVHECRRCRRETDRWRGPTRDDQWVASLFGQSSVASRTPDDPPHQRPVSSEPEPRSWDGDPEPAVRRVEVPRVQLPERLEHGGDGGVR